MRNKKARRIKITAAAILTACVLTQQLAIPVSSYVQAKTNHRLGEDVEEKEQEKSVLEVPVAQTGSVKEEGKTTVELGKEVHEQVICLQMEKAGLTQISLSSKNAKLASGVTVGLFADEDCTQKIKLQKQTDENNKENNKLSWLAEISQKTVYLKLTGASKELETLQENEELTVGVLSFQRQASLQEGKWVVSAKENKKKQTYFQLKVSKKECVTITFDQPAGNETVVLCNQEQQAITGLSSLTAEANTVTYVLKKGTYYVVLSSASASTRAKLVTSEISKEAGGTRKNPVQLSVGGSRHTGALAVTEAQTRANWYTFQNPKQQKIEVHYEGIVGEGELQLEFFRGKTSFGVISLSEKQTDASFAPTSGTQGTDTLPAGTYNIKVTKKGKAANGTYILWVEHL